MKKYVELLPQYLRGENILKHSSIIDNQDEILKNKIDLLKTFFQLERPILIQKDQSHYNRAIMRVYINSPDPIKKVKIIVYPPEAPEGIERIYTYPEDDLITKVTIENQEYDQIHPAVFLKYNVIFETYEGDIYEKGYPENDIIKNDIYDHDIHLDIIGNLLGITRRIYKNWVIDGVTTDLMNTYPPYFVKYDQDNNMIAGTEDDYYYMERLKYFIENKDHIFLPLLMMKVLYEWDNMGIQYAYDRKTSLTGDQTNYYYLIVTDQFDDYINIDDSKRQENINKYDIITRPSKVLYLKDTFIETYEDYMLYEPNKFHIPMDLFTSESEYIDNAPIIVTTMGYSRIEYFKRDNLDEYGVPKLDIFGLVPNDSIIELQYKGEYELIQSPKVRLNYSIDPTFNLELDYWKYGKYSGTSSTNINPPRINNDGFLSMGRNNITYTPALFNGYTNMQGVLIEITFHYGRRYSRLGITNIFPQNDNTINWDGNLIITPYEYLGMGVYSDSHKLSFKYVSNQVRIILDDQEIKRVENTFSKNDLFYIAGYSSEVDNDTSHYGLYIEEVIIDRLY